MFSNERYMNPNICNNCGGEYEYRHGKWICRWCGAYKPESITNEEATLLYTAYQKLRLADFAEAEQEFDDILIKYPENPNAYWGRLMARYGIKYEQDFDGRMIPTCYASAIGSLTSANDYRMALKYADKESGAFYRSQAAYIERVRAEWVEKAKREKPYDIFICYKESDPSRGIERTEDSYAAQELYLHLVRKGYRVFYSRESLIDKAGEKYEPYIFQALSTANVMIVYGSDPEYIRSTWLKNEWMRYAKYMRAGEKKQGSLIVACDGFSPSELPTALSSVQCLNAAKKSFYSDLDDAIAALFREKERSPVGTAGQKNKFLSVTAALLLLAVIGGAAWLFFSGADSEAPKDPPCVHEIKTEAAVAPTCTDDGYTESKRCILCGETLLAPQKLPALGHTPNGQPDCNRNRNCKTCGILLSTAGAHTFVKNICSACGARETVSEGLQYTVNSDKATCTVTGIGTCRDTELNIPCDIDGYTVTAIKENAFSSCSDLVSVRIAETVKTVGYGAFSDCPNLTTAVFPDSVTDISGYVFESCANLTSVTLGKGITVIAEGTFYGAGLTSMALPIGVKRIDDGAFAETNLTELRYEGTTAQWTDGALVRGTYWADGADGFTVYCADGIVTWDGKVRPFSEGLAFDSDGHGVASVTDKYACPDTELVIPSEYNGEPVKAVEDFAFEGANLTEVIFAVGMEKIGEAAFRGCDELARVMMPEGVEHIGYGAFFYCGKLTEVLIPRSVTAVEGEAFRGCESLRMIRYGGTTEQWSEIEFGENWDSETGDYTVYCTNGTVSSSDGGFAVTPGELPPSLGSREYEE